MRTDRLVARASIAIGAGGLRAVGKLNVPLYRMSRGRLFGQVSGSPVLLLTTVGRRTAQRRTAPVLYMPHGDSYVVIGSNAGHARTPAWSLNLQARPDAEVQLGGRRLQVRARVAEGDERAQLWKAINEQYRGFEDYESRTDRRIAVFVLEPR